MYQGTFGPVSNRAEWYERISIRPSASDPVPDVSEIVLTVSGRGCPKITKKLSEEGISYDTETGIFEFTIDDDDMRRFSAGTYDMGILLTISDVDEQLFAGSLHVVDGVVP